MHLHDLSHHLANFLSVNQYKDYCVNGLQVEGTRLIKRLGTAVTANQQTIDTCIAEGYDALLVHHGLFWGDGPFSLKGIQKNRVKSLLSHDISLLAYHLPLDMHPTVGNNVQLLTLLGAQVEAPWEYGYTGTVLPQHHEDLEHHLLQLFQPHTFTLHQHHERPIEHILVVTGGGAGYVEKIPDHLHIDLFITGEIKESAHDTAKERGISYLALGHHQSERLGVQALGQHIAEQFGIEHHFIDVWNPY